MLTLNLQFGNNKKDWKTFEVPTSWEDISIETYCAFYNANNNEDEEITPNMKLIKDVCLFTGMNELEFLQLPKTELLKVLECFNFLKESPNLSDDLSIVIDGEEYFFYFDFKDTLAGEEFTVQTLIEQSNGDLVKLLPKVLTLLLRKKIDGEFENYDISFLDSRAPLFAKLPYLKVMKVINFFFNSGKL